MQQVTLGIFHVRDRGVTTYVLGNVLWEVWGKAGWARANKEGRCVVALQKFQADYKARHIKYKTFRPYIGK